VLTFAILVPNAQVLGTDQFPAPAAQTWSAVAIALGQGLSSLESVKLWLIFAGGVVGVLLTLAPVLFPKYQEYLPSASAFGLAWVFPWYYGFLFFLGALVLLCHKFRCLFRAAQHGQRESVVARAATNLRRIVAIEFGTWRSGRNGGSSGLVTFAYGNLRAQCGGTIS